MDQWCREGDGDEAEIETSRLSVAGAYEELCGATWLGNCSISCLLHSNHRYWITLPKLYAVLKKVHFSLQSCSTVPCFISESSAHRLTIEAHLLTAYCEAGSGMAQGTRQMVESDQYGVASQVGFSQLKAQGASNANMMFTANLALRSVPTIMQPLSPVFSKGRGFVGAMYT